MRTFDKKVNSKRHIWRRFLAFTLCFCISFTAYPAFVFAQEGDGSALNNGIEPNADMTENTERQSQDEAAWTDVQGRLSFGSFLEAIEEVNVGGVVVLRSDIFLTEEITISKPMKITSWYANAPCTIKRTAADTVDNEERGTIFTVIGGCKLALQDIILDGGKSEGVTAYHPMICVIGAGLFMFDGAVLQNAENKSQSKCGGGVNVRNGGLRMQAGSMITDCKARHGGGVEVNSKNGSQNDTMLIMDSGSVIKNCTADSGGGVYVNIGQFQLLGGEITGNSATGSIDGSGGGGIYVSGKTSPAAVRIVDGKIAGNTAVRNGGGILVNGGNTLLQTEGGIIEKNNAKTGGGVCVLFGEMYMLGGTITDNTADLYGGGVLGSPTSHIYLQGNPKVFDNIAKDKEDRFDNLYLDGSEDEKFHTCPVRLIGPLTDGVKLGMTLWIRPDDKDNPCCPMIVPHGGYSISQEDLNRLCYDRSAENKELYADNMEKFGFIMQNGEIVMVLDVDVSLDKEYLAFEGINDLPVSLTATVTPANAPEKGVTWSSSDENVATVDENGKVTPIGGGRAVITATTKAPYHATASCNVTVSYYQLETKAEHGTLTYTPVEPNEFLPGGELVKLNVKADRGYRLKSLRAYYTDEESTEVVINDDDTFTMPNHYVTVEAVFEPIPYKISFDLSEGTLNQNETNPDSYTIENGEITLNNPIRNGYTFVGWTGTELSEPTLVVKIPAGSIGDREYRAVWEEENSNKPTDNEDTHHESSTPSDNNSDPSDNYSDPSDNNSEPSDNNGESSDNNGESSDNYSDSSDNNNTPSDNNSKPHDNDAPLTSDESELIPSESEPTYNDFNPPTGSAIPFVSLMAIAVIAAAVRKRK